MKTERRILTVLKFIRDWFKKEKLIIEQRKQLEKLKNELNQTKQEVEKWKAKYRNAKKWIDEITNDFHSYEESDK